MSPAISKWIVEFVERSGGAPMADYYPLIVRAVAALDTSTSESRRELYDRARMAQRKQLGNLNPPLTPSAVERERLALEDAIRRVEIQAARKHVPPPTSSDLRSQTNARTRNSVVPSRNPVTAIGFAPKLIAAGYGSGQKRRTQPRSKNSIGRKERRHRTARR